MNASIRCLKRYFHTPGHRMPLIKQLFLSLCFFLLTANSYSQQPALNEKVKLDISAASLSNVLDALDKQSNYSFQYIREDFDKIMVRDLKPGSVTLGEALNLLKRKANIEFTVSNSAIVFRKAALNADVSTAKSAGKITGKIVDEENGEPVAGATIRIADKGAITDMNGLFTLALPAGNYTATVSSVGFGTKEVDEINVENNRVFDLNVTLKREKGNLGGVTVKASARKESIQSLLLAQKMSASMTNGISAEQIRVTPDNNVAQVLRRVSGITIQSEKFVTIRGLSDRYNNVLINGATLPSTEPNRRNFSFDIVPSALIDNVIVNKTATPDLPGEFTGGLAQINTTDLPSKNFLSISIGSGFNTASAGNDFKSYKRDEKAWLGIVDPNRKWFGDGRPFDPAVYIVRAVHGRDTAYRNKVGGQIPNRWQLYRYHYTPTQTYQFSGGLNKQLKKNNSIGAVGALTYRNEMLHEKGEFRVLGQTDFASWRYKYNTAIGGLFNAGYKSRRHRFAWKNLYSYKYSNQFDEQVGAYLGQGWYAKRRSEVTLTNSLLHSRLEGEHSIGKINMKLDWFGDYIQQRREQPDSRFLTGQTGIQATVMDYQYVDDDNYTYNFNNPSIIMNGLYGSILKEKRKNAGGNFSLPFIIAGAKQLFKAGYSWSERKADYDGTGVGMLSSGNYTETRSGYPYYEIATQDAFRRGDMYFLTSYARASSTGDRYTGSQNLQGAYAMLDLKVLKKLRLTGGMRYEDNKMTLSTAFYNDQGLPVWGYCI